MIAPNHIQFFCYSLALNCSTFIMNNMKNTIYTQDNYTSFSVFKTASLMRTNSQRAKCYIHCISVFQSWFYVKINHWHYTVELGKMYTYKMNNSDIKTACCLMQYKSFAESSYRSFLQYYCAALSNCMSKNSQYSYLYIVWLFRCFTVF